MAPRSVSIPGGGGGSGGGGRGPCHCDHLMGSLMDEARVVEEGREKLNHIRILEYIFSCLVKERGKAVLS